VCQFRIGFKWNWWKWIAIWKTIWTKNLNMTRNENVRFRIKISNESCVQWILNEIWFGNKM
jgi:hypothetical protein